jgi:hypothetical protein
VDHDIGLLPHQIPDIGIILHPELPGISAGQGKAGCLGDAERTFGFRLVFGKILTGPESNVHQSAGIIH